jgi:iron complex transport system ATP-binding protein
MTGSGMTTLLEVTGLTYRVGSRALVDDVDLRVEPGEVVAVIGPNGAGKSTLCGLLAGDLVPCAGDVTLGGEALQGVPTRERARRRAVLRQRSAMGFSFPVRDVVMMGRHPHLRRGRGPERADELVVEEAMRDADVVELADRPVTTLSGGEQTRVALARVLAQHAPLLLLDEPTTALDLRHQHDVLAVCRRLADRDGVGVVAVLHDLGLAAAWADRIGAMRAGRMVACGPPREVLTAELVDEVFDHPVVVTDHPSEPWPVVVPTTRRSCRHGAVGC